MTRIPGAIRSVSALAILLMPSAALHAQVVSARAVVTAPKSSVRFADVVERSNGVLAGLEVRLQAGRLTLSGSGTRGRLTPENSPIARTLGEVSLAGRYDVLSWLGAETRYVVRAAKSAAGYQRWEVFGLGARVLRELGGPGVRASAGLVYSPVAHVTAIEDPTLALSADVGISLAPEAFPLLIGLNYRTERYRFPSAAGRSEQFEALTLVVGLGVRRQRGRWTLRGVR